MPLIRPSAGSIKRRACDECRSRKLACSKDPDGCERCKRENISCHYSEQKPMGRPRKRQFVENFMGDPVASPHFDLLGIGSLPSIADDFDIYNSTAVVEPYLTNDQSTLALHPEIVTPGGASKLGGNSVWCFGDSEVLAGPPINFGDIDSVPVNHVPPLDPVPQLSTISNASVSDSESSPPKSGSAPCGCLASMYLALSSLQELPTDIVSALRTVREAAGAASNSIWCPKCGSIVFEKASPPIEAFQNVMLLGTLLPTIANGYNNLLKMIDDETTAAEDARQIKIFQFHDYGGLCGNRDTIDENTMCPEKAMFFNAIEMPPQQWRTTVRALLRADIYGHEQEGFKHRGLKDLVAEMEHRQRIRHEVLDAQAATGTISMGHFGQKPCAGESAPHGCLQIIQIAKMAIDKLVIA